MKSELLALKSKDRVGNGRYEVLFALESTTQFTYVVDYSSFVVKDVQDSRCKILQALSKTDSDESDIEVPLQIQEKLDEKARSYVLACSDTFSHKRFLCSIQELHGPHIRELIEMPAMDSASWVRKVFRETLEALEAIHSCDLVHFDLHFWSIVITYPTLESADLEKVIEFYKPKASKWNDSDSVCFNYFGSGGDTVPHNLDFQVKLQNLRKAIPTDAQEHGELHGDCPPPELYFDDIISNKIDIWDLGVMMTNIVADAPGFVTVIGERGPDQSEKLFKAQQYLGPLPARYRKLLGREEPPESLSLLDEIVAIRFDPRGPKMPENLETEKEADEFCLRSLELATDLLKGMMRYDPATRFSAKEALEHEFFHQGV